MKKSVLPALVALCAALAAAPGSPPDWRALEDSLAGIRPWQRIRGLAALGLYDQYLEHASWQPMPDSGLRCVGRWSYGPSYKVSVQATPTDTLVLLTRGSGATIARFRSGGSVVIEPLGELDCNGIPHRAIIRDSIVYVGVQRGGTGLETFDIRDLTAPRRLASVSLPSVNDIAVSDTTVYLACADDTLRIYSVADPASPVRLGACRVSSDLAMFYADGYCYLVHVSGVNIVDVRDPRAPAVVGRIAGHEPTAIWVRDSLCYITTETEGFLVFDVREPSAPSRIGGLSGITGLDIYLPATCDTVAYTSYFHIINIADPAGPRLIGQKKSPGWDNGICVVPSLDFALHADHFDGIVVLDITDPAAPVIDTMILAAGLAVNVSLDGDRAFLASQYSGLAILDVSDPTRPTTLGVYDTVGQSPVFCGAAVGRDSFAFLSWPRPRVLSIDVSDPTRPVRAGGCEGMFNQPEAMVLRDSFLYTAQYRRFQVVNVARPREPVLVGSCDVTGIGLWLVDTLIYIASSQPRVVNVADPTNPHVVGAFGHPAWNLVVCDTVAFLSAGPLVWYNVADPTAPFPIDSIPLNHTARGLAVVNNIAYVSALNQLHAVNVADLHRPEIIATVSLPYTANRIIYAEPYLYLSCWDAGVAIFETTGAGIAESSPRVAPVRPVLQARPNPVSRWCFLDIGRTDVREVSVRDVAGRRVVLPQVPVAQMMKLDFGELPPGLYFVEAASTGRSEFVKVIKR